MRAIAQGCLAIQTFLLRRVQLNVWKLPNGVPHPKDHVRFLRRRQSSAAWQRQRVTPAPCSMIAPATAGAASSEVCFHPCAARRQQHRQAQRRRGRLGCRVLPPSARLQRHAGSPSGAVGSSTMRLHRIAGTHTSVWCVKAGLSAAQTRNSETGQPST